MVAAIVTVLICAVLLQIFQHIGYALIGKTTFEVYKRIFKADASNKIHTLKKEVLTLRHDLTNTSAQDEFAKWAKIRRALDKKVADFEELSKSESSSRASFEAKVSWGLWIFMWIFQMALMTIYSNEPIFYIPDGWLGPFTYLLSLPMAPKGSVSVFYWFYAVKNVTGRILQRFP
ncbi:hypothetical protein SmJEL517_g00971 [Synchytrium microbalum]|uniref:Guided entry of tail-anchored proteins 1 n=1 Tax=Synchytrium microbalum TaxID=1806994 RepID=A0A507CBE6_9FUNG|nr:uncharacterized protein SmJEL517_g00971 [Synchytrium microbalum]TPX36942.1 hypothetical protein SmJEL517_g00971 [Synchytrium microbalum]